MPDRIDHAAKAESLLYDSDAYIPGASSSAERDRRVAQAQVHATLALVDAVNNLAAQFGQCVHGYTICPYCIRNGIQGIGL